MVRTVVGTALAVAQERDPGAAMSAVIAARDRAAAGPVVPPQGLVLEQVFYDESLLA
jgi:tRNA pseudouridine38-40 synthase